MSPIPYGLSKTNYYILPGITFCWAYVCRKLLVAVAVVVAAAAVVGVGGVI